MSFRALTMAAIAVINLCFASAAEQKTPGAKHTKPFKTSASVEAEKQKVIAQKDQAEADLAKIKAGMAKRKSNPSQPKQNSK